MRLNFLITGLVILLVANVLMLLYPRASWRQSNEGFANYFLENAGGAKSEYKPIGAFDGVKLTNGGADGWKKGPQNTELLSGGHDFELGPDSLFMFKDNVVSPECASSFSTSGGAVCSTKSQRDMINSRGSNRSSPSED